VGSRPTNPAHFSADGAHREGMTMDQSVIVNLGQRALNHQTHRFDPSEEW